MVRVRRDSIKQFSKYLLVGLLGATVDFSLYLLLTRKFNLPSVPANLISVFMALVNNFFWNKYFTFKAHRTRQTGREFSKFFIINVISYVYQQVSLPLLLLIPFGDLFRGYQDIVIKAGLAFATGILTYVINRNWTFRNSHALSQSEKSR